MNDKKINTGYFMERLSEPSTWRGILAVLTACGIAILYLIKLKRL